MRQFPSKGTSTYYYMFHTVAEICFSNLPCEILGLLINKFVKKRPHLKKPSHSFVQISILAVLCSTKNNLKFKLLLLGVAVSLSFNISRFILYVIQTDMPWFIPKYEFLMILNHWCLFMCGYP